MDKILERFGDDKEIISMLELLQKKTNHTDEEILDAIDEVYETTKKAGLSLRETVAMIVMTQPMVHR